MSRIKECWRYWSEIIHKPKDIFDMVIIGLWLLALIVAIALHFAGLHQLDYGKYVEAVAWIVAGVLRVLPKSTEL
jgi:hypothetical protein